MKSQFRNNFIFLKAEKNNINKNIKYEKDIFKEKDI
jgi:hypothetical protein